MAVFTRPLYQVRSVTRPESNSIVRTTTQPLSISNGTRRNISATVSANVANVLDSELGSGYVSRVEVSLDNVQTLTASEDEMRSALEVRLASSSSSCRTLRDNFNDGIRLDVIETLIVADPTIDAYDSAGAKITIDPNVIRKIDAKLDFDVSSASDGSVVGEAVGVGYTRNPNLARNVFRDSCN